jgi:hypothetical protein
VFFSVLRDESTSISNHKTLVILARYVSPSHKVETRLVEFLELDGKDGSAKTLHEHFKKCLENKNIPLQNIVGLACNGGVT